MVILAILAGIVIISIGGVIGRGQATAYNSDREQIEAAVAEFMTRPTDDTYNHVIGEVPVTAAAGVNASDINGSEVIPAEVYYVVAMCPLTTNAFPKGILKQVPATAATGNMANSGANAEAGADASCLAAGADATADGHYLWYTTDSGDVVSLCQDLAAGDCTNLMMDGFQDVYP
jgi:hypothetical protein